MLPLFPRHSDCRINCISMCETNEQTSPHPFQLTLKKVTWFRCHTANRCRVRCRGGIIWNTANALSACVSGVGIQRNVALSSVRYSARDANLENCYQTNHLMRLPIGIVRIAHCKCPPPIFNTYKIDCNLLLKIWKRVRRTILKCFWRNTATKPHPQMVISPIRTFCCMSKIHLLYKSNMH